MDHIDMDGRVIRELTCHLVAAGGKGVRPMRTVGCARVCCYQGDSAVLLAACVEFIHAATLLHDDVVDESDRRRGNPTSNVLWGNQEIGRASCRERVCQYV